MQMVTCERPPLTMLPIVPINPFVMALKTSSSSPMSSSISALSTANTITTGAVTAFTPTASVTMNNAAITTTTVTITTPLINVKPKLAFSIDALVGVERTFERNRTESCCASPNQKSLRPRSRSKSRSKSRSRSRSGSRSPQSFILRNQIQQHVPNSIKFDQFASLELWNNSETTRSISNKTRETAICRHKTKDSNIAVIDENKKLMPSQIVRECKSPSCCQDRSQSPALLLHSSRSSTPLHSPLHETSIAIDEQQQRLKLLQKASLNLPNLPPGLIRPFPLQASQSQPAQQPSANALGLMQPLSSPGDTTMATGHLPHATLPVPLPPHGATTTTTNPHLLAAQFQMAAVLAHHQQQRQQQQQHQQQQQQHQAGLGPPPPPPPLPPPPLPSHLTHAHHLGLFPAGPHHPHHPTFGNPHLIRDTYPLYPWLLSRHGRIFSHRFPGFLLQPFRKPKRVRTAFSPTQLLKLEHAFEENHYVVGAERKQLAQGLNLTETQVKVWFQNRRTKHKRMQQESDSDTKSQKGGGSTSGDNDAKCDGSQTSYDEDQDELEEDVVDETEDEVIDMDDYDEQQHEQHIQDHEHEHEHEHDHDHDHDHDIVISAEERHQRMTEHLQQIHNRHFTHNHIMQQHQQNHHQQQQHLLQQHQQYFLQQQQQAQNFHGNSIEQDHQEKKQEQQHQQQQHQYQHHHHRTQQQRESIDNQRKH